MKRRCTKNSARAVKKYLVATKTGENIPIEFQPFDRFFNSEIIKLFILFNFRGTTLLDLKARDEKNESAPLVSVTSCSTSTGLELNSSPAFAGTF